jgi:conjugative relaxase-like TrwC/TraI family protein
VLTIRAMSSGEGYSARHLEHSDYYAEGERVVGLWQGRGAEALGLTGDVTREQFEAVRQGLHPGTGEFLRPRHSADRLDGDGHPQSRGRHLYDFTFSAPKSVSVMAELSPDDRLIDAHRCAVQEALAELEAAAAARVRLDGANENRTTGNLVLAVYHHNTSRELDPQLHSHAVAGNLTYDGAEGRWKALQASAIYEQRAFLTEVYRNALARDVRALGYEIDDRRDARGHDLGFEIQGVSDDLLQTYSQRSQQRDRAIDAFTERTGRRPTDNEVAVLVRDSRADKLIEISTVEVRHQQLARLGPEEAHALGRLREQAHAQAPGAVVIEPADHSLRYAEGHIFERVSVAQDHELVTEALRHGRGRLAVAEVQGQLELEAASGELLRVGHEVATRESLDRERQLIATINGGVGRFERLGAQAFVPSDRLRPEQQHAVRVVLASRDFAVNLRGAAGTGKTATLEELHRSLRESGRDVLAVAPTRSAVDALQQVGFTSATTVQQLLEHERRHAGLRGAVLIVDEAGMVSGRQMQALLALAEQHAARIVFSGDTRQLQSVDASDALRMLERESRLQSVSLTQVQRQTVQAYREAIEALRDQPARGFAQLERMGAVLEVAWADRTQTVADAWRQAHTRQNAREEPSSVLVVCATHAEIGAVTEAIRADRLRAGELSEGVRLERYAPVNYTLAQKRDLAAIQPGQVLVFHRATHDVKRHEALDVVQTERDQVVARSAAGVEHITTGKQAEAFEVYERRPIEIAANDRLLLLANRREAGFRATNGETVTVSRVDGQGRLSLKDGRTLPADYKHFDYGYAVTAHRSQGKTVDAVVIAGEMLNRELFYVAASRGRERVTVVTSDKALLQESIGQSGARQSASELVRKMATSTDPHHGRQERQGLVRGLSGAVALARQAAGQAWEHERELPLMDSHRKDLEHDRGQERSGRTPQVERGQGFGLGW